MRHFKNCFNTTCLFLALLLGTNHLYAQGKALNFDGVNDYISLGNSSTLKPTSAISVGVWVCRANWSVPALQAIISNTQAGGYSLNIANDGTTGLGTKITVLVRRNSDYARPLFDAANLSPGWHHLAFTYDGKTTTLYVDGKVVNSNIGTTSNSVIQYHGTNSTLIGAEAEAGDTPPANAVDARYFSGNMDELRMYNVALSATEVKADMLSLTSVKPNNLVAHYNFDGSDHTLTATVGNNVNLRGFGLSGATSNWIDSYAMVVPVVLPATDLSFDTFTANWDASLIGTADDYVLEVATNADFSTPISGSPFTVNGSFKELTGLNGETTYYYRVRANKASIPQQGLFSDVINVTTLKDHTIPEVQAIASQTVCDGNSLAVNIALNANDPDGAILTASSSNQDILTNASLSITGTGAQRVLNITTAERKIGMTYITIKAENAASMATEKVFELGIGQTEGKKVSTLVGGSSGHGDGEGVNAKFNNPSVLALDEAGNIYLSEFLGSTIRKITPKGVVTTLAGDGGYGNVDGIGTASRLNYPTGIAVATDGVVYFADSRNYRIRKIATDGTVSTFAGTTQGMVNGDATIAKFNFLQGLVIDKVGNIFVADESNNAIRKITPLGEVSTFATINSPEGLTIDTENNLYVSVRRVGNNAIYKITSAGVVSLLAGGAAGYQDGNGASAKFDGPRYITVDVTGNVYVPDYHTHYIRKISPDGTVTTLGGNGIRAKTDGHIATAQFNFPTGLAVDKNGVLYIAEQGSATVRKITTTYTSCKATLTADAVTNTLYVNAHVVGGDKSGDSWSNAIPELADALKWANDNNYKNLWDAVNPLKIYIAKGTYKPKFSPRDGLEDPADPLDPRDKTFMMVPNVKLYGGFDPATGINTLSDTRIKPSLTETGNYKGTILSGDFNGDDVVTFGNGSLDISGNSENAYHVLVKVAAITDLDGLGITGGNANTASNMIVNGSLLSRGEGGGIISWANQNVSAVNMKDCVVSGNYGDIGGGISTTLVGGAPNAAVIGLINSEVNHNSAGTNGAAIYTNASANTTMAVTLTNSNINANSSVQEDGTIYVAGNGNHTIKLLNTTVAGNIAPSLIYAVQSGHSFTAYNSLVGGNSTTNSISSNATLTKDIKYSFIAGQENDLNYKDVSNHNLPADVAPAFKDVAVGDYSLAINSAAIGKGSNLLYTNSGGNLSIDTDIAGKPRVYNYASGGIIDIGAYEYQGLLSQTISFAALDPKTTNSTDFTLGATASSGLAVSYTSSNTAVAEVYQDAGVWKVKIKAAGNTDITALQAGDANYSAATDVPQELVVVGGPLPVTLVTYTAKVEANYAKLQWQTTNEQNNKGFIIYRSGDDKQFVQIGEVSATINHQPLIINHYNHIDKQPLNGHNYYKLVQLDQDGKPTELGIRPVAFNLQLSTVNIYPNPTLNKVNVTFERGKYEGLVLSDNLGRVLQQQQIGAQTDQVVIDLSAYATGVYFINLKTPKGNVVKKVVKQ